MATACYIIRVTYFHNCINYAIFGGKIVMFSVPRYKDLGKAPLDGYKLLGPDNKSEEPDCSRDNANKMTKSYNGQVL